MIKQLLTILFITFATFATNNDNWNWLLDIGEIEDTLTNGVTGYTEAFNLSNGEDTRVLLMVDDTSSAGFASDSVNIVWGYQTGSMVINTSNVVDTLWDDHITIDTCVTDSFGVSVHGSVASDGSLTREWNQRSDTSSVTGYAVQSRWFIPEWDMVIRFWSTGVTGNNGDSELLLRIAYKQRLWSNVKVR